MDNDDRQIGRILHRREMLALLGAAGGAVVLSRTGILGALKTPVAAAQTTTTAPTCIVVPELTEGPYFVDDQLNRSDIRSEPSDGSMREGVPFGLTFNVSQIGSSCAPLPGAHVDVWHCDALGIYSGVQDNTFPQSTVGEKFLRGYQITDDNGVAQFTSIYPGWYQGRAVHIHFKIRTTGTDGKAYEFTSQFFLDDSVTDQVHTLQPYASKGQRTMRNSQDGIYQQGGSQLLLTPVAAEDGSYAASFAIGLNLADTAVGAADGMGGGGRGPGGAPPPRR